jgi:hypothetical protein
MIIFLNRKRVYNTIGVILPDYERLGRKRDYFYPKRNTFSAYDDN